MTVAVRFAPSPTGFLHIGGARTALFNWLFARHHQLHGDGGQFHLRIEDTDRVRSTEEAVTAIIDGLKWLGLDWDGEVVFQSARAAHHAEIAQQLLAAGRAYRCYSTSEELEAMRERAKAEKRSIGYDGTWRDRDPAEAPPGIAPAIRLKSERTGATTIRDHVMGEVTVENQELDDLIILRSDGTPTYNFSVVVDDHDMGITHVIRGNEHFRNAFRQTQIYRALDWKVPEFAHIPLIHGADGAKMSKRHGALGVEAYRDMGYLPDALRNYLLRLGWSHGDDEIISTEQSIEWFDLPEVPTVSAPPPLKPRELLDQPMSNFPDRRRTHPQGRWSRSPAQFDFTKLNSINAHYLRNTDDRRLVDLLCECFLSHDPEMSRLLTDEVKERLFRAMAWLKTRSQTLREMAEKADFCVRDRPRMEDRAAKLISEARNRAILAGLRDYLSKGTWALAPLQVTLEEFAARENLKLTDIAQPLRAALTGSLVSPPIFDVMAILGKEASLGRIADAAQAS
jgi:glutamyl-tRNA synthetase